MTQVLEEKPKTMPIDLDNPCPVCGHPLRDHEFMGNELFIEADGVETEIKAWAILCMIEECEHAESPASFCFQSCHPELVEGEIEEDE